MRLRPALTTALVLWLATTGAAAGETVELSRDEALTFARAAWGAGDAALANAVARSLLGFDPEDVEALLLLCVSEEAMGRAEEALSACRRAWAADRAARAAGPSPLTHEIARRTAFAAHRAGQDMTAGWWLRRAVDAAPSAEIRAQNRADLARLRDEAPLSFTLSLSANPTTNLNGGTTTDLYIVNDWLIGTLGGWSIARPGWVLGAEAGARVNFGVSASGQSRLILDLGAEENRHVLTAAAAAENPTLDPGDLDSRSVFADLTREVVLPGDGRLLTYGAGVQKSWFDGVGDAPEFRLRASYSQPLGAGRYGGLAGEVNHKTGENGASGVLSYGIATSGAMAGHLDLTLSGAFQIAEEINANWQTGSAVLAFAPEAQLGPFQPGLSAGLIATNFQRWEVLPGVEATGGRFDLGGFLTGSLSWPDATIGGLTPSLSVTQSVNLSNISKYETRATSFGFSLTAEF